MERLGDRHGDGLKGAVDVARNSRRANGSSEKASRLIVRSSVTMVVPPREVIHSFRVCVTAPLVVQGEFRRN